MGGASSLVGGASGCHDSLVVISSMMRRARGSFLVGGAPGCRSDVVIFSLTLNQRSSVMGPVGGASRTAIGRLLVNRASLLG